MATKMLSIESLAKRHPVRGGGKSIVFEDLWLALPQGGITCIVGPPGCGKTALINILAGVETASDGVVILDGHEIEGLGLERALLTAEPCLLPWRTVLGNVGYAVRAKWRDWSSARAVAHVRRAIERVGLSGVEDRWPAALSPGMKQRVALARALAVEPKLLLLDEPFAALDAITRAALHDDLRRLCGESGITMLMATHDLDAAILLADRIVLMSKGPRAQLAEILQNELPAERKAADVHRHPLYYAMRSHIADFLASRSPAVTGQKQRTQGPREVPQVRVSLPEPAIAASTESRRARAAALAALEATTRSVEEARNMPSLRNLLRKTRAEFGE